MGFPFERFVCPHHLDETIPLIHHDPVFGLKFGRVTAHIEKHKHLPFFVYYNINIVKNKLANQKTPRGVFCGGRGENLSLHEQYTFWIFISLAAHKNTQKVFDSSTEGLPDLLLAKAKAALRQPFVGEGRIELPLLAKHDFESCASTNSATRPCSIPA
jgi:hypothetical protein